jgi:hypothetical protein
MDKDHLRRIGETLDRIVNTDISLRGGIAHLYEAARELSADEPLVLRAAALLKETIKPKDRVLLTTGWMDQPEAAPGFGETDGPGGAAVLARAVRKICGAACVLVTDAELVEGMKKVAQAAGFHCVAPAELDESLEREKLMTMSILPFPVEDVAAQTAAAQLLDDVKPVLCVAIERGGMNEEGRIHSMVGKDTSRTQAKVDYIFRQARERRLLTIGVGDGGNEIGMANIKDRVKAKIPYGNMCLCGCGKGIAPSTPVDFLLTATISNWGCHALADMLAVLGNRLDCLHTPELEERILKNAADNGFHDAMYGGVEYSVDGCPLPVHLAVVTLLATVCRQGGK